MADRFKRHVDSKCKSGDQRFLFLKEEGDRTVEVQVGNSDYSVLRSIRHVIDAQRTRGH
jgi:hypothetical protein